MPPCGWGEMFCGCAYARCAREIPSSAGVIHSVAGVVVCQVAGVIYSVLGGLCGSWPFPLVDA